MKRLMFQVVGFMSLSVVTQLACGQSVPSPTPKNTGSAPAITRAVKGQVLTSAATPAVKLEFNNAFKYVGGQSFILYDIASAEQHFFVNADEQGRIKRFYWVQFEGYLPGNTHTYDYKSPKTVNAGGFDFFADAYPRNIKGNPGRADSDGNRARAFLTSKGYRMASDDLLSQRLVHLVDEAKRNELMIIYIEDLGGTDLTAADLGPGGSAAARWDDIAKGLLERALKNMTVKRVKRRQP